MVVQPRESKASFARKQLLICLNNKQSKKQSKLKEVPPLRVFLRAVWLNFCIGRIKPHHKRNNFNSTLAFKSLHQTSEMLSKAVSRLLPKRTLRTALSPLGAEERAAIDAGVRLLTQADAGLRLLTQADAEIPPYIAKHLVGKDGKVNPEMEPWFRELPMWGPVGLYQ